MSNQEGTLTAETQSQSPFAASWDIWITAMMLPTWILLVPALISRLNPVFAVPISEDLYAQDAKAIPLFAKNFNTRETRSTLMSPSNNGTDSGLQAWPRGRYSLALVENFYLQIKAERYTRASPPLVRRLQGFIFEFADNIESEYPPPGLSPQRASSGYYDLESFTKFEIDERVFGMFASRAPTAILINALTKIAVQIRRHGPPELLHGFIYQPRPGLIPVKSFNLITLEIHQIESHATDIATLNRRIDSSGIPEINAKK
ncbi:MAG: hypothetical protein Q9195_000092 [Heterodermia aff. obscurata]